MSLTTTVDEFIHTLCAEPQDVLTRRLYEYVAALAEADYDPLRTACFLQWCEESGGVIAEVGRVFEHVLGEATGKLFPAWTGAPLSAAAVYRARQGVKLLECMGRIPRSLPIPDAPDLRWLAAWRLDSLLKEYPPMSDPTAVNDARVLESELFDYVTACAEGNDDMLRYSCLIAWAAQQPGAIAEVGRIIDYAIRSEEGPSPLMRVASILSVDAQRLLKRCSQLLREHSGFKADVPLERQPVRKDWDYAYFLGIHIGHLLS